jgi:hypothetical protein
MKSFTQIQRTAWSLAATLSVGGSCTVLVEDVLDDAAQADTGYPMKTVGTIEPGSGGLKDVLIGVVTFDQPGLKLIRFMSNVSKQSLQVDRIQLGKFNGAEQLKQLKERN